jgi:hypothetical protein
MSEIDIVKEIAHQVLSVTSLTGTEDNWLWDRTQRVLKNVEYICSLPELTEKNLPIDKFCLTAAVCLSEAGLACATDTGSDDHHDFSTQIVTDKLAGTLSEQKIDKINKIITESGNRLTNMYEAMILSDARNLDDMGAVGLFSEIRKYAQLDKGVVDILQVWKRKLDYQYFQARLKESFRFESVRELARQRYAVVEHFMNQLQVEHTAADLEKLITELLDKV